MPKIDKKIKRYHSIYSKEKLGDSVIYEVNKGGRDSTDISLQDTDDYMEQISNNQSSLRKGINRHSRRDYKINILKNRSKINANSNITMNKRRIEAILENNRKEKIANKNSLLDDLKSIELSMDNSIEPSLLKNSKNILYVARGMKNHHYHLRSVSKILRINEKNLPCDRLLNVSPSKHSFFRPLCSDHLC